MNLRLLVLVAAIAAVAAYGVKGTAYSDATCQTEEGGGVVENDACNVAETTSNKVVCVSNSADSAWTYTTYATSLDCTGVGLLTVGNNSQTCAFATGFYLRVDCSAGASVTATILAPVLAVVAVILSKRL
jgi:hypothetical protein